MPRRVDARSAPVSSRDGLRIAEELGDRGAEADLLGWLAVVATNRLRFVDALDHGPRSAADAGRAAATTPRWRPALDGLKTVHAYLGEIAELALVLDELEPLLRRLGDP